MSGAHGRPLRLLTHHPPPDCLARVLGAVETAIVTVMETARYANGLREQVAKVIDVAGRSCGTQSAHTMTQIDQILCKRSLTSWVRKSLEELKNRPNCFCALFPYPLIGYRGVIGNEFNLDVHGGQLWNRYSL